MNMPPVKWKLWICVTAVLIHVVLPTDAQQMQDPISVSSDGWRPIVGTRRQSTNAEQPISQYPAVQSSLIDIEATTQPFSQQSPKNAGIGKGTKVTKPKQVTKIGIYRNSPTGPQQGSTQTAQPKKLLAVKKMAVIQSKHRKPSRGQMMAHSSRNEIFVPPPLPSSPGLVGGNQYNLVQQAPINYVNQFAAPGTAAYQRPSFLFAKPVQNDEYTRNLVPPPPARPQQNKDNTKISLYSFKEGPLTDASSNYPQFGVRSNQFAPQVSPIFDYTQQVQQQQLQQQAQQQQLQQLQQQQLLQQQQRQSLKTKDQTVDVQVTKENVKQYSQTGPSSFGVLPGRNNFPIEFVDYDFHSVKAKPTNLPNTLTYEVTEGKWLDTSSQQYQFHPLNPFIQSPKVTNLQQQQQVNARPGILFQAETLPTKQPVFQQTPIVDLSVPAFLPTPYRPLAAVVPTIATESDVSTVFNKVTSKMNQYKNQNAVANNNNPLYFNIKDVSTHYPVVGKPEIQSEASTNTPLSTNENAEISNDITTQKEFEYFNTRRPTQETTRPTVTRDPTKARITNRRRPRPRRPTTTTEEPVVEMYELVKENIEETPVETERPVRRRRPRPTTVKPRTEDDNEQQTFKPEEQNNSKQRGRYRFRPREPSTNPNENNGLTLPQRKRFRPSFTENIVRDSAKPSMEESTESSYETQQNSFENYPVPFPSHIQERPSVQENNDEETRNQPFIEEIHPGTQRIETSNEEVGDGNRVHVPENEIDYTTQAVIEPLESSEEIVTTTTTTQPTTTTTEAVTARTHRIRVRPNKFDNSNRPRFSVKDYRQRLNQLTSTTPTTTTEENVKSTTENVRLRFQNRIRTRPPVSPTTASNRMDEDSTEDSLTTTSPRPKFKPNQPRYHATTDSDNIITENSVKAVNTRLRPFGKQRTTTEATTVGPKVTIRPNFFANRRRSGYPSLKSRLENKNRNDDTKQDEDSDTKPNSEEEAEVQKVAESGAPETSTITPEFTLNQATSDTVVDILNAPTEPVTDEELKVDDLMHSQRVSDLTSSFKDYDKPGLFNSVAPTSRSIPNYFTLSTEDPILPIEAFFPNLKEKDKTKER
ncbi:uncharacterized protein LOC143200781 isoform X3 [Rhynchophorus ferrugineus]|uniref:uncharacterized protein LOC143200781 isoform X3 n=1 Tax=Rhynchophorus ferrugineus TaxID=354439 RepID=UPI003FCC5F86